MITSNFNAILIDNIRTTYVPFPLFIALKLCLLTIMNTGNLFLCLWKLLRSQRQVISQQKRWNSNFYFFHGRLELSGWRDTNKLTFLKFEILESWTSHVGSKKNGHEYLFDELQFLTRWVAAYYSLITRRWLSLGH